MEKKIKENWNVIEKTEQLVQEKTGDPKAGFNASTYFMGSTEGRHLMLPCMYRGIKGKKDNPEFTSSYKEMMVYAHFCPFSGKPLYENSIEHAKQFETQ